MTLQAYSSSELGNPILFAGAAAAIYGLFSMTPDSDDWSNTPVFQANMRKIHAAMQAFQCLVGGAQAGQSLLDSMGSTLCEGGTQPICKLTDVQLATWRGMRDNFSRFWADTMGSFTIWYSEAKAQGQQAQTFAKDFRTFYASVRETCPNLPEPNIPEGPETEYVKYALWGLGLIAVTALAVSAKSIFGGGTNISVSSAREEVGRRAQAMAAGIRERTAAAKQRMGLSELEAIKLKRIRVNANGYDAQGRQWGLAPVFKVHDNVLGHSQYVRARSPWEAEKIFNQNAQDLWQLKSR